MATLSIVKYVFPFFYIYIDNFLQKLCTDTYTRSFGLLIYLFHLATNYKHIPITIDILFNILPNGYIQLHHLNVL